MSLDPKRDLLVDAGAALREIGTTHYAGAVGSLVARAVHQVGLAIYGRNSLSPKLQREAARSALRLVEAARTKKGAPPELGTAAILLRTVLRNLKRG